MSRKRYQPEEIIAKLRETDPLSSQGAEAADGSNLANWMHAAMVVPTAFQRLYTSLDSP